MCTISASVRGNLKGDWLVNTSKYPIPNFAILWINTKSIEQDKRQIHRGDFISSTTALFGTAHISPAERWTLDESTTKFMEPDTTTIKVNQSGLKKIPLNLS